MKVPSPTEGRTRPSGQGLGYLRPAVPDLSPIFQGLNSIANAAQDWATRNEAEARQTQNLKSLQGLSEWQIYMDDKLTQEKQNLDPADANFDQRWEAQSQNEVDKFVAQQPPELQEEFRYRAGTIRQSQMDDVRKFVGLQRRTYAQGIIDKSMIQAELSTQSSPESMADNERLMHEKIDAAPGYSITEKAGLKAKASNKLHMIGYEHQIIEGKRNGAENPPEPPLEIPTSGQQPDQVGGDHPIPGSDDLTSRVIKHNEGYRDRAYWDVDAYRAGYGSDTYTTADGAVHKVTASTVVSREDADHDLKRRKIEFRNVVADQVGRGTWDKMPENVQAALTSVAYNYGSLPRNVVRAVGSGNINAIASAVGGLAANPDRRRQEASLIRGNGYNIDTDPTYADVTFEQRMAIRDHAETQYNQEQAANKKAENEAHDILKNKFFVGFHDGTMGQKELDWGREHNVFTNIDDIKKGEGLIKDFQEQGRISREFAYKISDAGRGGNSIIDGTNEEDKKGANAWVGDDGVAKISAADKNYADRSLLPMIDTAHYVPPVAAGTLAAMLRSNDANKRAYSLDVMSRIQDTDEKAFNDAFGPEDTAKVDFWRTMHPYLSPEEMRVGIMGPRTQEERQARAIITEQATKLVKESKGPQAADFLTKAWPWSSKPTLGFSPIQSAMLQKEMNAVFIEKMTLYNDPEKAAEATEKAINRVWGPFDLSGQTYFMKFPPDKVGYRSVGAPGTIDYSYIERQVRNELNIPPEQGVQLIADGQTEQEYAATKRTQNPGQPVPPPPSYQVLRVVDGTYKLETLPDGTPNRRHFTVTSAEKGFEEHQFSLDRAKTELDQFYNNVWIPATRARGMIKEVPKDIKDELADKQKAVKELEARTPQEKLIRDINNKVGHEFPVRPEVPHPPGIRERRPVLEENARRLKLRVDDVFNALFEYQNMARPEGDLTPSREMRARDLRRQVQEMLDGKHSENIPKKPIITADALEAIEAIMHGYATGVHSARDVHRLVPQAAPGYSVDKGGLRGNSSQIPIVTPSGHIVYVGT